MHTCVHDKITTIHIITDSNGLVGNNLFSENNFKNIAPTDSDNAVVIEYIFPEPPTRNFKFK